MFLLKFLTSHLITMENAFRQIWEKCNSSVGAFDRNGELIKAEVSKSGLFDAYACKNLDVLISGKNFKRVIASSYHPKIGETCSIIYIAHKHPSMDIDSVVGTDKERLEKEAKIGTSQCRYCMSFEVKK